MEEVWTQFNGFPTYEVSSHGRIRRRLKRGGYRILKCHPSSTGYLLMVPYISKVPYARSGHRVIAEHFIPNPENKSQVNHKNGFKDDNRVENLEWVTPSENALHANKNGLAPTGTRRTSSRLTEEQVKFIRSNSIPSRKLGTLFGVSKTTIKNVRSGRNYGQTA